MTFLRYFDIAVVLVAAPIMLVIGVPALGYLLGTGTWIALRAAAVAADRLAVASGNASTQISIRLVFMLGRLFLLAGAVIVARQSSKNDGLAALVVIAAAFTISMALLPVNRPRKQ
jgi:predicted transporter